MKYNRGQLVYSQLGQKDEPQTLLPRQKFQFSVSINHLQPSGGGSSLTKLTLDRISSMDLPSYSSNTTTVNNFNKKKLVQTGITYDPVTLTAYDTRDGDSPISIENFLRNYFTYYYAGTMSADADTVTQTHNLINFTSDTSGSGFKLQPQKYFIDSIVITRKHIAEGTFDEITLYNPIINSVAGDTLDYSDSGAVQYRIQFSYEAVNLITGTAGTTSTATSGVAQGNFAGQNSGSVMTTSPGGLVGIAAQRAIGAAANAAADKANTFLKGVFDAQ